MVIQIPENAFTSTGPKISDGEANLASLEKKLALLTAHGHGESPLANALHIQITWMKAETLAAEHKSAVPEQRAATESVVREIAFMSALKVPNASELLPKLIAARIRLASLPVTAERILAAGDLDSFIHDLLQDVLAAFRGDK